MKKLLILIPRNKIRGILFEKKLCTFYGLDKICYYIERNYPLYF